MQHRQTHTLAIFGSSRCVAPYADGLKRILKTRALADAFRCYHLRIAIDFLIIGQGLAGTVLAWNLIQRGRSVIVLDREDESTSSKVAAGLINPITGRYLTKSWRADETLPVPSPQWRRSPPLRSRVRVAL